MDGTIRELSRISDELRNLRDNQETKPCPEDNTDPEDICNYFDRAIDAVDEIKSELVTYVKDKISTLNDGLQYTKDHHERQGIIESITRLEGELDEDEENDDGE